MSIEEIKEKMADIKKYLNKNWQGIGDHFEDRLLAKIEYENLTKTLCQKLKTQ